MILAPPLSSATSSLSMREDEATERMRGVGGEEGVEAGSIEVGSLH